MRNRLNKIVVVGLVLTLVAGAAAQAVTKIDKFASGSDIAITGERWLNQIIITGRGSGEMSNEGNLLNPEGYAELKDVVLDIPSWNDWAEADITLRAKNNGVSYDLAQCSNGFRYKYMGSDHRFFLHRDNYTVSYYKEVADIDGFFDWVQVTVDISSLTRDTYDKEYLAGNKNIPLDLSKVAEIDWSLRPSAPSTPDAHSFIGYLKMKDFECLGTLDVSRVTPIRLSQTTISNIRAKAIGNVIELSNLPKNATVELYNLQGKRIYFGNSENSQILRILVQTKGMYIATIQENRSSNKVRTKAVVK